MHFTYQTQGVCASEIHFDMDSQGVVTSLHFTGGCEGNLRAVSLLAQGGQATDLIALLSGNRCGSKDTSCTDQLARALEDALREVHP